jgi:hypothetical protein
MKIIALSTFLVFCIRVNAQLIPISIPSDGDSICDYPVIPDPIIDTVQKNNYVNAGFMPGDTVPMFKLYDLSGDSMELEKVLDKERPVLLISGSYTCPVFRERIDMINIIAATYSNLISMWIIYQIEPHPDIDISPYSGTVWTNTENYTENILYRQPLTYGARKAIVSDMINNYIPINMHIVIDGPCNDWWLTYGPAPNIAYLITPDGVVFTKHGWFNQAPYNMTDDIDSILGTSNIEYSLSETINTNLTVFSDPGTNNITFNLEGNDYMQSIILFDLLGKEVMKKDINNIRLFNLDISRLASDVYAYQIFTKHQQILCGKVVH